MAETAAEIEENFAFLDSWEDRYRYIIELGAELPPYPEAARDAAHKVPGCVSQVWLLAETKAESGAATSGAAASGAAGKIIAANPAAKSSKAGFSKAGERMISKAADPILYFKGDSDAHIVKGLVYIILALYSGKKASEILAIKAEDFLARLKLAEHLTPQRSNGLRSMVERIRTIAENSLKG